MAGGYSACDPKAQLLLLALPATASSSFPPLAAPLCGHWNTITCTDVTGHSKTAHDIVSQQVSEQIRRKTASVTQWTLRTHRKDIRGAHMPIFPILIMLCMPHKAGLAELSFAVDTNEPPSTRVGRISHPCRHFQATQIRILPPLSLRTGIKCR